MKVYSLSASISGIFNQLSKDIKFALGLKDPKDLNNILDSSDPTAEKGNYLYAYVIIEWLYFMYEDGVRKDPDTDKDLVDMVGISKLEAIFEEYFDYLSKFEIMRSRGVIKGKPKVILKNKSFKDMVKQVNSLWKDEYAEVSVNWSKANKTEGWSLVFSAGSYKVYEITSVPAARLFGKGTSWCFGRADNYAKTYAIEKGPLHVIFKNGKHYMAVCNKLGEWKDPGNMSISVEGFTEIYPFMRNVINKIRFIGNIVKYHLYVLTPDEVLRDASAIECYDYLIESTQVTDPKPFIDLILERDISGEWVFKLSCLKEPFDILSFEPLESFEVALLNLNALYWVYRLAKFHSLGADKAINNYVNNYPSESEEDLMWKIMFSRLEGSYLVFDDVDTSFSGIIEYGFENLQDNPGVWFSLLRELVRDNHAEIFESVFNKVEEKYETPGPTSIDGREFISGLNYSFYNDNDYFDNTLSGYIRFFRGYDFEFIFQELARRFDMAYFDKESERLKYKLPKGIEVGDLFKAYNLAYIFKDVIEDYIDGLEYDLGKKTDYRLSIEKLYENSSKYTHGVELEFISEYDMGYARDEPDEIGLYGVDAYVLDWEFDIEAINKTLFEWFDDDDFYNLLANRIEDKFNYRTGGTANVECNSEDFRELVLELIFDSINDGGVDVEYQEYGNEFYKLTDKSKEFLEYLDSELAKFYDEIKQNIDPYISRLYKVIDFSEIIAERDQLQFDFSSRLL